MSQPKSKKRISDREAQHIAWAAFVKKLDLGPWNCSPVSRANMKLAFDHGYKAAIRTERKR